MEKYEYCCQCGEAPGRAGAGDDSLYTEHDGPFCEACYADSKPPAAPVQEQALPEFFAALEYNSPDWDVFACVYRCRADATPELVHREQLPRQAPAAQPAYTKEDIDRAFSAGIAEGEKLGIEAQPAQQEPKVDLRTRWPMNGWKENKATPPAAQRQWVDLTHAQFAEILCDDRWQGRPELMLLRAQQLLKELNK